MRGKGHEPPLTVLAEDELPVLADPVDREDEADGVGIVVVVVPVAEDLDEVVVLLDVVDVAAFVCAAATATATAIAATAAVPSTPNDFVSLPRRRSARSRSAAVMRRFGAGITGPPGGVRSVAEARFERAACREASAAHRADR
jgi:hypothetical protein